MKDTKYFTVVTDLGTKKMLEAVNEGKKVNIVYFAVGDGSGQYYKPDTTLMELKNEVWRGNVRSCEISEESENVLVIETVIPSDTGGFTIREMAVFDEDNTMVAICNTPDTAKVRIVDGVVHELKLQMEILLNNKDSVEMTVDPNIITATKEDVLKVSREVEKIKAIIEKLTRYSYNSNTGRITNMLPFDYAGGKLTVPDGMGHFDNDKLVLTNIT
ncbi:MAG: phage tail protein [Lachnospiraceae bacterium]|nr:phage tail protein [Lachnospiraceae bacterium]